MSFVLCVIASLYYSSLWCFPLVSHPVSYCLLLLFSSSSAIMVGYFVLGFSWYIAIFGLVYLGGVYVLFIFISIINPNSVPWGSLNSLGFLSVWFIVFLSFIFLDINSLISLDCNEYICSEVEGFTYCNFCLVLLVGFTIVSLVSSNKSSFYR